MSAGTAVGDAPLAPVTVVRRVRGAHRRRTALVAGGLTAVLVAAVVVRLTLGDFVITPADVLRIVTGTDIPGASYILMEGKLPRAVLGVLVGGALGCAGAIFQTTLRNPLASPEVIGVSLGASTTAALAVVTFGLSGPPVSALAVAGALATAVLVRWQAGTSEGHRLVLVGIGVAAALQSVTSYLLSRADEYDVQRLLRWLTGSLNGADWPSIRLLAGLLLALLPALVWLAPAARVLELGPETAAGLGVPARRADQLLLVAVLLVAVAVAAAGPVAFVAFLAGPIARALNSGRTTLTGASLAGAVIVVAADHVGAYAVPGVNLPVGVVTGACGAPFLLWLLARGRTSRRIR